MALASVVRAYLEPPTPDQQPLQPQQPLNELRRQTTYHMASYASSAVNSKKHREFTKDTTESQINLLFPTNNAACGSQLLPATRIQNAFFRPIETVTLNGPDDLHFAPPQVHVLLSGYPVFGNSLNPGGPLLPTNAAVQHRTIAKSNPSAVTQKSAIFLQQNEPSSVNTHSADYSYDSHGYTDEAVRSKETTVITDTPNLHSLVLIIRLLMSGKEVGSIIGKRGENVKKYREESGARINISDGSSPERIVTVIGTVDQIFVAFSLMSQKFEDDFTRGLLRTGDESLACPPVTLRLLVPAIQCGPIIGRGGCRIKDVRELTGASIQVASEALPSSTERTVTVSGTAKAIAKCVRHLCEIFVESPVKGSVIPYRPKLPAVNETLLCPPSPLISTILQSEIPTQVNGTEQSTSEIGASFASSSSQTYGLHSNYMSLDVSPAVATNFTKSSDCTSTSAALPSSLDVPSVADLMRNSTHLHSLVSHLNYFRPHVPTNGSWGQTQFDANGLNNPFGSGNFSMTDLASFSPDLLGFYVPQNAAERAISEKLFFAPNFIKAPYELNEGCVLVSQNNVENRAGMKETQPSIHDPSQFHSPQGFLSYVHTNEYLHHFASLVDQTVPLLRNETSLLGLPNVPLPPSALEYSNTGMVNISYDGKIMKELTISNELVGCIIGRGGTTVNEIRNISKAQIRISNCENGAKERKITLSGSSRAVDLAHLLINNRVSTELFTGMLAFINQ